MKVNAQWQRILDAIQRLGQEGGRTLQGTSRAYVTMDGKTYFATASFRPAIDDGSYEVYHLSCDGLNVHVQGPYLDNHDDYWLRLVGYPNALITPDYQHFTVSADSSKPGWGDGHGGAEFSFELEDGAVFSAGKIIHRPKGKRILITHNLWAQGIIPPAHRSKFKVNARPL